MLAIGLDGLAGEPRRLRGDPEAELWSLALGLLPPRATGSKREADAGAGCVGDLSMLSISVSCMSKQLAPILGDMAKCSRVNSIVNLLLRMPIERERQQTK